MINSGVTGRSSRGKFSEVDNFGTSLLHAGSELISDPFGGDKVGGFLSLHGGVANIRVHGGRVVSPEGQILHISDLGASLECDLCNGTVLVETGHGGEVSGGEIRRVVLSNEAISVGRVSNNDGFGVASAVIIDGLANVNEDLAVVLEEIGTFHSGAARLGTNEEVVVDVLEGSGQVRCAHDIVEEGESAIVQFSLDSLQDLLLEGQVEEVQNHTLVFAQEFTAIDNQKVKGVSLGVFYFCKLNKGLENNLRGNSVDNGVGDLTSGAGDKDTLGFVVEGGSCHGTGSKRGHSLAVSESSAVKSSREHLSKISFFQIGAVS